jgi:isoleucyl-tRNA synthetase
MIEAEDALARMGADVMRWQYCAQPPDRNLLFGFGPAHEVKRKLLTLWNSVKFLVDYGRIEEFRPSYDDVAGLSVERPLDRWLVARTDRLVQEATDALEEQLTFRLIEAFDRYVDDLSNWYIRRSRRRFWDGDETALRVLWYGVVQGLRVIAPVMPFLAEHLWQNLVRGAADGALDSVFLAGWPVVAQPDTALLDEVAEVRRVVRLGHQARQKSGIKLRQPLAALSVEPSDAIRAHQDEIAEELRVEKIVFGLPANRVKLKPDLPVLGPKLGADLRRVQAALEEGRFELPSGGRVHVEGFVLEPDEVRGRERVSVDSGWVFAEDDDGTVVALDRRITPELQEKGQVLDLIHLLNTKRKEAGLELTDRITVTLPEDLAHLLAHEEWIKSEVLAVAIETDGAGAEPTIAKV